MAKREQKIKELTVYRKQYRGPDFLVEHVDLVFELDLDRTFVSSRAHYQAGEHTRSQ